MFVSKLNTQDRNLWLTESRIFLFILIQIFCIAKKVWIFVKVCKSEVCGMSDCRIPALMTASEGQQSNTIQKPHIRIRSGIDASSTNVNKSDFIQNNYSEFFYRQKLFDKLRRRHKIKICQLLPNVRKRILKFNVTWLFSANKNKNLLLGTKFKVYDFLMNVRKSDIS